MRSEKLEIPINTTVKFDFTILFEFLSALNSLSNKAAFVSRIGLKLIMKKNVCLFF